MNMKPPPAVFTRQHPCTKLHLWNCFRGRRGFLTVPVVQAQALIGVNAPRVMERAGNLTRVVLRNVDYYRLTPEGEAWLTNGASAYLRNHPSDAPLMQYPPAI